ncbi:MAG: hypothetical protein K2M48_05205 [Clostridiales bacterium]|nr:hypothetical protein [Clostridiales bacterium]
MVIVLALSALLLTGCGASLTVSAYTENGTRYNEYAVEIDLDTVEKMERTAASNSAGEKYTVYSYLFELFSGYDCSLVDSRYENGNYVAVYRKAFYDAPPATVKPAGFVSESRLRDITEQISYTTDLTRNPFTRNYRSVSADPFNGVRAAYDEVRAGQSATVIQRLKNGLITSIVSTGETVVLLPSVQDAFPYVKGADVSGFELRYVNVQSKRMDSNGTAAPLNDDYSQYVFSRYFDDTDREIVFEYVRPEVYGWYIVALAAGAVTLAAFVIATRTKKQKPTLLDRFPYNPEEFRDYETRLPRV